jgi:hypothetical protein
VEFFFNFVVVNAELCGKNTEKTKWNQETFRYKGVLECKRGCCSTDTSNHCLESEVLTVVAMKHRFNGSVGIHRDSLHLVFFVW